MLSLHYKETAQVSEEHQLALLEQLDDYREQLVSVARSGQYVAPESSIVLPSDDSLAQSSYAVADRLKNPALRFVFVVGIGGSNLGTKAIYDALGGSFDAYLDPAVQLIFLDTTSPELLAAIQALIARDISSPDQLAVVLISKSGGTTETVYNGEILLAALKSKLGESVHERVVVVTDEGSALGKLADTLSFQQANLPNQVGGRFSVFSAVGLVPLALAGIDVESLRAGARDMREVCLHDSDDNSARNAATVLYAQLEAGKVIHDLFTFVPHLASLGLWYRQLTAESVGKETNLSGEEVRTGVTPTVSVGSTDLHSVAQLYLGGPRDKVTTFVSLDSSSESIQMPHDRTLVGLIPSLHEKTASSVMSAILEGTKIAYQKNNLPFMEVVFDEVSPYTLGAFMQFKMMEIMYLGHLLDVNTFDQPNVESYKTETKKILDRDA